MGFLQAGLEYAGWTGSGWEYEVVDSVGCSQSTRSLGYDRDGHPLIVYHQAQSLAIASPFGPATLHRGVSLLEPGWKTSALPLASWNDDETSPFPVATESPGTTDDNAAPAAPLLLYRLLWSGDRPARNTLRLVKQAATIHLSY